MDTSDIDEIESKALALGQKIGLLIIEEGAGLPGHRIASTLYTSLIGILFLMGDKWQAKEFFDEALDMAWQSAEEIFDNAMRSRRQN